MIAKYYGVETSIASLRDATNTTRMGTSLQGLRQGGASLGFRTLGVKISFEQLITAAPLPLIAHWDQQHFIIVYKVTNKKIYVSDPAIGLVAYSHDDFLSHWVLNGKAIQTAEGVALLFSPTPAVGDLAKIRPIKKFSIYGFLKPHVCPHWPRLAKVFVTLLLTSLIQLAVPFLTQNIVDKGIFRKDLGFIWLVLIAQLSLTLGGMAIDIYRNRMLLYVSSHINIDLISGFFIKLMRLPIRFFDNRLTGDLLQRIQDHHRIESFLTSTALNAVFSCCTLVLCGVILACYSVALILIFLLGSIFYIAWILFFLKKRARYDNARFQQMSVTQSKVIELINGMQEIKLHNAEHQKRRNWETLQHSLFRLNVQSLSLDQVQASGSRIINEIKNILLSVVSARLVINGEITLGMMLAAAYMSGQMNSPVLQLINVIKSWQDARLSLNRLGEIHQKRDEQEPHGDAGDIVSTDTDWMKDQDLIAENLSFSYDTLSAPVLKNLNLRIPAGTVTAIVGSSGSGKTTLIKLLMKCYEPTSGSLKLSAADLATLDVNTWRKHFGAVMQEGFIFNDTIAGNIAVGIDNPDVADLEKAAEIANLTSVIKNLPMGYNTLIGQEGLGLSAGQLQRILIARAVYKAPHLFFFDEATSALDANNERAIMQNLERFYKGKTVVIIAHRLSTVKNAGQIIVLDEGQIIEQGSHSELISLKGAYFRLIRNQLELSA